MDPTPNESSDFCATRRNSGRNSSEVLIPAKWTRLPRSMQKTSDEAFFALCEYFLSDPQTSAQYHRTFTEKLIYNTVRHLGWGGLLLAYAALVVRDSAVFLSCFKHVVILDIHAKLILRRDDIRADCRSMPIRRRHFPSRQIIKEMASAHRRYIGLRRRAERNADGAAPDTLMLAASNEMYPIWLLHFYVHRSIILANAETIRSAIRTALTLEEFTPLIAGYLSAFSDLQIPLILYLPGKLAQPELTLQAWPLFSKVVVKNGGSADFLRASGKEDVLMEESAFSSQDTPHYKGGDLVGAVYLASFYTLNDAELIEFLTHSAIPYLRRFQEIWQPLNIRVFCHPNDGRARSTLEQAGFHVAKNEPQSGNRMEGLDLVLSGNTSVIDEALAADVPVIYCGKLDNYSYDLIGYVKEGLVFDATHACPTRSIVEDFFAQPQTRTSLQRYRRGSGLHRSVRLIDEIQ
jgi:hypothetical protein